MIRRALAAAAAGLAAVAPAAAESLRGDFSQRLLSFELQDRQRVRPPGVADPGFGPYRGPDVLLFGSGTLQGVVRASAPGTPTRIDRIRDLFPAVRACWRPPAAGEGPTGMEVTIRLAFKRDGALLGQPRVTYHKAAGSPEAQERFRRSIVEALQRCTPFPFTAAFGGAVAGRPFVIRFVDDQTT